MNFEIDGKIGNILEKDFKKFKSKLFDLEDGFYEEYKNNNFNDDTLYNYFIYAIINQKGILQKVYKKLMKANCDKKKINEMFYTHLKFQHKATTMQWSINELCELDLDIAPDVDVKFTNYKFF
tara:strand:- start:882 stop:1250 length:369 start_codon:yes stop_codon:yes gene_type:complete